MCVKKINTARYSKCKFTFLLEIFRSKESGTPETPQAAMDEAQLRLPPPPPLFFLPEFKIEKVKRGQINKCRRHHQHRADDREKGANS